MNEQWIEHAGALRRRPVGNDERVSVVFRDGTRATGPASIFQWANTFGDKDVVRYRTAGAEAWHDPDTGRTVPKPPPISAEQAREFLRRDTEAGTARVNGGVAAVVAPRMSDAEIDKVWRDTPAQGDPTGKLFYRYFARAVLAANAGVAAPLASKFMPGAIFAWNCLESTAARIENIEARNTVREFLMRAWHHEVQPAVSAADGVDAAQRQQPEEPRP